MARSQGLKLEDEVEIMGQTFIIIGLTRGLTNIVNSVSFIRLRDFQVLRPGEAISYALLEVALDVGPAHVAAAINARNEHVLALPTTTFSREERRIVRDMSVEILNIMNLSGFLIGLAVTALTLYTSTLRKRQEYGVLKAIGAKNNDLYVVVATQAALSLALGFVAAVGLVWLLGQIVPLAVPGMGMTLTQMGLMRVLVASLVNRPDIILADEPTANLDSHHGHEIMRLLRHIAKQENRSVIFVSHDQRIEDIADRVLWLEDVAFKNMVEMVADPVCGMSVDKVSAPAQVEIDGRILYFCANGCREEFLAAPEQFLDKQKIL